MPPKTANRSSEAEDGYAMRKTQRADRSLAWATSDGEESRTPRTGLLAGLRERIRQGTAGIGDGEVTQGEENARTAATRRGSQGTSEGMPVVEKYVRRRCSVAYSEPTRSDKLRIEAFMHLQRESRERIENGGVAESEEVVGRAAPRRGSKGTPEAMRVVGSISGKRGKGEQNG